MRLAARAVKPGRDAVPGGGFCLETDTHLEHSPDRKDGVRRLMSSLQDFISGQNIDRFLEQLSQPLEPSRSEMLLRLLMEEEDRLGRSREQFDLARQRVTDGASRIGRLKTLAACYPPESDFARRALAVTATLERTQELIEAHYQRLRTEWRRERLDGEEQGSAPL